ncbi:putative Transposable element Tc1 transposase-like 59, partial [Homarus americanus]
MPPKRPAAPSGSTPKRARRVLTLNEKNEVLKQLGSGMSYAAVGRHFGLNESSVRVRQVQKWIKKFRDGGGEDIPTPKPRSGRPRKIQNRTSKVIKRQLDKNPTLTARKLKENNPALLQDVS